MERYRWLGGIIAAHPQRQVFGRTRLQKTVRLLQSVGVPTDYDYASYFYGPYSESLKGDIGLLEQLGLVKETLEQSRQGDEQYYLITATAEAELSGVRPFQQTIKALSETESTVLELAATYLAYRELGLSPADALSSLRQKKGRKCGGGREQSALGLLNQLNLPRA